ncbi:hypothetical protein KAJ41_01090 [Candidatus Parcubacteria bacterium]|nr:hypothetical protein [Candidatus Parcubacteria bacterium]
MNKNKKKKNKTLEKFENNAFYRYLLIGLTIFAFMAIIFKAGAFYQILININDNISKESHVEINKSNEIEKNVESKECDSDFLNIEKWTIDDWWKRDSQVFAYNPENDWGPKMTFNQKTTNNFHMVVNFVPILNEKKEINFVVYIGNSYKIILGDGNNTHFYLKQGDNFISEANSDFVGPIELANRIRFDEPVEIEIIQSMMNNSNVVNISLNFRYYPEENKNSGQATARKNPYIFQVNDNLYYNNEKEISLGLLYSEKSRTTIVTKFNCFKLKNR